MSGLMHDDLLMEYCRSLVTILRAGNYCPYFAKEKLGPERLC
jgi:hypothetical protein